MTPDDQTAYEVLLERIEGVKNDTSEIRSKVECLDKNYQVFREEYTRGHATMEAAVARAHERIDEHDEKIAILVHSFEKQRDLIQPLIATNKILSWMGGTLGGSVLLLIWLVITGQVQLQF